MLCARIFHKLWALSLKDLVHKDIFLGRAVLIDTVNQEKFLCGSKIKRERCRFMKYPGSVLFQGAGVAFREAQFPSLEEATHDLAASGFGKRREKGDLPGRGSGR